MNFMVVLGTIAVIYILVAFIVILTLGIMVLVKMFKEK